MNNVVIKKHVPRTFFCTTTHYYADVTVYANTDQYNWFRYTPGAVERERWDGCRVTFTLTKEQLQSFIERFYS